MSLVLQMRSERAKLNDQLQALAKIEADGDSLTAEQLAEFGNLESQINALTDKISRAESAERAAASAAVPVNESARGITGPPEGRVEGPYGRPVPGASVAQMVRLLAATQGNQSEAAKLAKDGGYGADVQMALSTVTPGAGGVLVPENMA
ncbi:phage major capsid protein, partial [Pseudomonas aeruginosa]